MPTLSTVNNGNNLSDLFVNIIAQARFTAEEESLMLGLITQYNIGAQAGTTIQVPKYPAVAAADLTEGTDMSETVVHSSSVPVTVTEKGAQVILTDVAQMGAGNPADELGTVLGNSIATKIDQDIIATFRNFTSEQGNMAGNITAADIFKAVATLRGNKARGPLYGVVHPFVAYDLKASLTNSFSPNTSNDLVNEAMRSGYIGTIAGVQMFESANVLSFTDLGDDGQANGTGANADTSNVSAGAIFTPEAIAVAMKRDFNLEAERNASLRATELNATAVYGTAVLDNTFGVRLNANSAFPSQ